jgi:hypothetical protein
MSRRALPSSSTRVNGWNQCRESSSTALWNSCSPRKRRVFHSPSLFRRSPEFDSVQSHLAAPTPIASQPECRRVTARVAEKPVRRSVLKCACRPHCGLHHGFNDCSLIAGHQGRACDVETWLKTAKRSYRSETRQIAHRRFRRVPFHLRGIFRAQCKLGVARGEVSRVIPIEMRDFNDEETLDTDVRLAIGLSWLFLVR